MLRQLQQARGLPIARFCGCGFHDPAANHCAHWVAHFLGYRFGFTCRDMTRHGEDPATLRVHELFPHCPVAGAFDAATAPDPCLVFIAHPGDIDPRARIMRNVPRKHVGIFHRGSIHHYSNTQGCVIEQSPSDLLELFRHAYGPATSLFFGTLPDPQAPRAIPVDEESLAGGPPDPASTIIGFHQDPHEGAWHASIDGRPPFFVGRPVGFRGRHGLHQHETDPVGPRFAPAAWTTRHGQAAVIAGVVGHCESSNRFCRINTYDRAAFTFGFLQLAAHTPDDNLILLFRAAMVLASFRQLFPDLRLLKGRLHQVTPRGTIDLETISRRRGGNGEPELRRFMDYLNPDARAVGEAELRAASALIAWTRYHAVARRLQAGVSIRILSERLRLQHDPWYDLHGKPDTVCAVIADIHHQGRARRREVAAALRAPDPVDNLLDVGTGVDRSRCERLRLRIAAELAAGRLGRHCYDRASACFTPAGPRPWPA